MALTKWEGSDDFECVLRDVPITGTNHSVWYEGFINDNPGEELEDIRFNLVRDKTNNHDPNAVRVMVDHKGLGRDQVGWIGMQTGHSAKVAKLLDACPISGGYILITHHDPRSRMHMTRLRGDVYLPVIKKAETPKATLNGPIISDIFTSDGIERANLLKHGGKLLNLVTNDVRTSVSLQDAHGNTLGWYRKSEYPKLGHKCNLQGRVALVITAGKVMVITKAQAEANGYAVVGAEQKLVDTCPVNISEYGERLMRDGGSQVGKVHEAWRRALAERYGTFEGHFGAGTRVREIAPDALEVWQGNHCVILFVSQPAGYLCGQEFTFEGWAANGHQFVQRLTAQQCVGKLGVGGVPAGVLHYHLDKEETAKFVAASVTAKAGYQTQTQPPKETTMLNRTSISTILSTNKNAATSAAYSEAGRIANNAFAGFAASKAPLMIKGYIDTPFGKLLLANIASVAQRELRPNDARLAKLTEAMLSQAFVALYQDFDIEGALAKLLDSTEIKRALGKLEESEAGADASKAAK